MQKQSLLKRVISFVKSMFAPNAQPQVNSHKTIEEAPSFRQEYPAIDYRDGLSVIAPQHKTVEPIDVSDIESYFDSHGTPHTPAEMLKGVEEMQILFGKTIIFNQKFIDFFSGYNNRLVDEFFAYQVELAERVLKVNAQRKARKAQQSIAQGDERVSFKEFYKTFHSSSSVRELADTTPWETPRFAPLKAKRVTTKRKNNNSLPNARRKKQ